MITSEIIDSIDSSVLCWLATVSEDGIPNVSPKEAFMHDGEGRIIIAHVASPRSVENIQANSNVCISFINIFTQKGCKINGVARILCAGDEGYARHHALLAKMLGNDHEILAVIEIEPTMIDEVIAPSYNIHPDVTELDMVQQSLGAYRVSEYRQRVEQGDFRQSP